MLTRRASGLASIVATAEGKRTTSLPSERVGIRAMAMVMEPAVPVRFLKLPPHVDFDLRWFEAQARIRRFRCPHSRLCAAPLSASSARSRLPAPACQAAHSRLRARSSGINVDVAPLRANAGDPTAAWVARALPGALAQALAEVGRAGAPISVRIDYVILGPSSGGVQAGGAAPDQMIGEVIVGGIAHELRGSTSYYPMAVDQPNFEQSNYDRIVQLCQAFAYWAARGM